MAATLIQETDVLEVSSLAMVIYGPPGTGKTTLAQTAKDPITLDLDRGIHRSFNRKAAMRFDSWQDIEAADAEIAKRSTVVVDTIGRALDLLALDIIAQNPKHGTRMGGLSLQGFGSLKARYANWSSALRSANKDAVLLCHEKEEKDGDDRIMRPDVQGGSYTELMKACDLVGYLYRDRAGKRFIDFNPSDRHLGKNAAGWDVIPVPELKDNPTFLADLLADAKARIGKTAEASAEIAKAVDSWTEWLGQEPDLETLNAALADLSQLSKQAKTQSWAMIQKYAQDKGWAFDKGAKAFKEREGVAA